MRLRFRRSSLRGQLAWISIVTSSATLLVSGAAFLSYELYAYRVSMLRTVSTYAESIAASAAPALSLEDPQAAAEALAVLKDETRILDAQVFDAKGKLFASYVRPTATDLTEPSPHRLFSSGYRFENERLILARAVISEDAAIGLVHIQADNSEMRARIREYAWIAVAIFTVSVLAALLISRQLNHRLADPLLRLVAAAERVSTHKDFTVRVPEDSEIGETALLARTFNAMLAQIQQQNEELQRAVKARDEFISVASHELKTPLMPLRLQIQSLVRRLKHPNDDDPADRFGSGLTIADRQITHLEKLINDLLDISRITSDRIVLVPEPVELATLVGEVVERFEEAATKAKCEIKVFADQGVIGIWDRARLDQVLTNLLSNAIKYGPSRPIEVRVEGDVGLARLRVRDDGIGIAPADQARIFERFERAVSERHYGGFGLGLWIARQIVASMSGTIRVISEPGAGAEFIVELPRTMLDNPRDAPRAIA